MGNPYKPTYWKCFWCGFTHKTEGLYPLKLRCQDCRKYMTHNDEPFVEAVKERDFNQERIER
jgi:hypothetical protein